MIFSILQQYWGYDSFRPFQKEIIDSVMNGKDTLAILPTGAGKSLTYQLPALANEGLCIVVSPLIALMQNQVMLLQKRGIHAAAIYTGMKGKDIFSIYDEAMNLNLKLLYLTPERIQSVKFQEYLSDFKINLIAIDEAHCISQWGHDFRPAYREINVLNSFFPNVPKLALTASATLKVQEDIIQQLQLSKPSVFKQSITRPNLSYNVQVSEHKPYTIIESLNYQPKSSAIVYTRSRKLCEEYAARLTQEGLLAYSYHAGMDTAQRAYIQQKWIDSNEAIMCATSAFGMGVDKPNVRAVIHYDIPESLEEYYQECGRAGRDGIASKALLFYNNNDISRLNYSIKMKVPDDDFIKLVYNQVGNFLQIATHEGEGQLYSFDVLAFASLYKLEMIPTINAIRILAREGYWIWNELSQIKSSICLSIDNVTIQFLKTNSTELYLLVEALLRMYDGIFHFETYINEYDIAKYLGIDALVVIKQLKHLDSLGFVIYHPALKDSTLYLLNDRVPKEYLTLNKPLINALRIAHKERVEAMLDYVNDKETCRSILLANYFGESLEVACGICDNCKVKRDESYTLSIRAAIKSHIKAHENVSITDLVLQFQGHDKELIITLVRQLCNEGDCSVSNTGIIFAK